jgi:hypothetical protein
MVLFRIENQEVFIETGSNCFEAVHQRASFYLPMLNWIAKNVFHPEFKIAIPALLEDLAVGDPEIPLFSFQKSDADKMFLLPDFDCIICGFYEDGSFRDSHSFFNKNDYAIFVGSTTGIDPETHATLIINKDSTNKSERLRLAFDLWGDKNVRFRLPNVTQVDSEDTRAYLASLPFCKEGHVSLDEQFRSKFLISVDGNGATCQRVALALRSNSVLLKYHSNQIVWYHKLMVPFIHYVPAYSSADISRYANHARDIGFDYFKEISENASSFYRDYLTKENTYAYMSIIINEFYRILNDDDYYIKNRQEISRRLRAGDFLQEL